MAPHQCSLLGILFLLCRYCFECARTVWLTGDFYSIISEVPSTSGLLIVDVRRFSNIFFSELRYSHTKKEGNKVAHNLIRYALHISDYIVWMEDVPPQIFLLFIYFL